MKQKPLSKSFFLLLTIFSLCAFLFVNVHAGLTVPSSATGAEVSEPKVEEHNDRQDYDARMPDATALGRAIELLHRLSARAD